MAVPKVLNDFVGLVRLIPHPVERTGQHIVNFGGKFGVVTLTGDRA